VQLSLFDGLTHPVLERLRALDANTLTPLQALQILVEIGGGRRSRAGVVPFVVPPSGGHSRVSAFSLHCPLP